MASVNMIPWEQALAAEKAAFDQNRQLMMMGVAPEGGFRNDYAYMGDTFDPVKWLQQKGFWQQGFRPGMDLPQMNASTVEDAVEMATPFAVMAATAAGGNALFGPGGLFAGAPAAGSAAAGSSAASGASAAGGSAAGGGAAAGGAMMPPAIPPVDPTFGGALSQVSPGVFANTGNYAAFGGVGAGAGALAAAPAAGTVTAGGAPVAASASGMPVAASALPATTSALSSALPGVLSNPQVLGMGAGALMGAVGGGGGPAGATTTTTDQGLPDWLMPYAKPALDKYSSMVQNYNVDPYGVMPSAMQEYQKGLSGYYLDPSTNKYLNDYFNAGAERIKSTVAPSFGHMQAFGGHSGYNEALSRGLADFSTGLFGGAYNQERDRMSQYSATAPSFLQQSTNAQMGPYSSYLSTIGSLGQKSTSSQPYFEGSDWQKILGGAMTGWGLGNVFK